MPSTSLCPEGPGRGRAELWTHTQKKTRVTIEAAIKAERDARAALTFLRAAVLLAGGQVPEAVGVAKAAAVVEELALHAGHVEEVLPQQGAARAHLVGESADLGDFWREMRINIIFTVMYACVYIYIPFPP